MGSGREVRRGLHDAVTARRATSARSHVGDGRFCEHEAPDPISSTLARVLLTWKCLCSKDTLSMGMWGKLGHVHLEQPNKAASKK